MRAITSLKVLCGAINPTSHAKRRVFDELELLMSRQHGVLSDSAALRRRAFGSARGAFESRLRTARALSHRPFDMSVKTTRVAPYLFPAGAQLGKHNLVLHASARRHSVRSYAGPPSIKTVRRGRVSWVVGGRELVVCPTSFLFWRRVNATPWRSTRLRRIDVLCVFCIGILRTSCFRSHLER